MKFTILCALLLSFSSTFAKDKKSVPGCEEMDQPHMQREFKMCVDAQKKMEAAIKMSKSKGCAGMKTPEYRNEYMACKNAGRVPASKK